MGCGIGALVSARRRGACHDGRSPITGDHKGPPHFHRSRPRPYGKPHASPLRSLFSARVNSFLFDKPTKIAF